MKSIVQTDAGPADMSSQHVKMTVCENGSFCCGIEGDASTCCDKGEGKFIVNGKAVTGTSTSISSSTATSTTVSSTSKGPSSNPNNNGPSSGSDSSSNAGTIAGGVVGGIGAVAILGFAVWFILRRRRRQNRPYVLNDTTGYNKYLQPESTIYKYEASRDSGPVAELNGSISAELPGTPVRTRVPGELPA